MQFLASLHIVLTCSVVVLLAYLLSRLFTYLAHSVIHTPRRSTEGSIPSRRSASFQSQLEPEDYTDAAMMARLREEDEEDEEDDDKDTYQDAEVRTAVHTSKFDMGGGIFDNGSDPEYDVKREDAEWDNGEGMKGEIGLDTTDNGRCEARELECKDNGDGGMRKEEDAGENRLKEEKGAAPNQSVIGDAQGSSSMQKRLPPTWSDLEQMLSMSSKKHSPPPSVSPVPEYG